MVVPATFTITSARLEAGVGDRLSPVPPRDLVAYVPHPPGEPMAGRIVSIYGDGADAPARTRSSRSTAARATASSAATCWRCGATATAAVDNTDAERAAMQLPDERHGLLFVFRVFERVSYALILSVQEPVSAGDRFTQP